jgi:hypothetical protein
MSVGETVDLIITSCGGAGLNFFKSASDKATAQHFQQLIEAVLYYHLFLERELSNCVLPQQALTVERLHKETE